MFTGIIKVGILSIGIITFIAWYLVVGADFGFSLTAFIAVVIVACPCAMGIATPTAILVGAAKRCSKRHPH
jgi:Cu+-exporting ATPase